MMTFNLLSKFEDERRNAVGKLWYVKIIGCQRHMLANKEILHTRDINKTRNSNDWDVLCDVFLLGIETVASLDCYIPPLMHVLGSVLATQELIYAVICSFNCGVFESEKKNRKERKRNKNAFFYLI